MKALLLLSGGLDSTVMLHQYADNVSRCLSFNYGSKHNSIELQYAKKTCDLLSKEMQVVDIDFNALGICSTLLKDGEDVPDGHYQDECMKQTIVPFRNGILLSIAAAVADSQGLDTVMIANHKGDYAIYPDCRYDFIMPMSHAIRNGTSKRIILATPYLDLTKRQIALRGFDRDVNFDLTYSCYKGGERHCGVCGACVERKEALAGFDNTEYVC